LFIMADFGTATNAYGDATLQSTDPTRNNKLNKDSNNSDDFTDTTTAGKESALGSDGTNALGGAPSDTYGTRQTGGVGTFGQASLTSGAFDDAAAAAAVRRDDGFGATSNAAGLESSNYKDPASSSGLTGGDALVGSANDSDAFGSANNDGNAFGTTTTAGGLSGVNDAGGIGGTTGAGAGAGPHQHRHDGGEGKDSTVGKIMQKAGEVLGSEKLQHKGQLKREQKGSESMSSA
jgi:hypothetical protein